MILRSITPKALNPEAQGRHERQRRAHPGFRSAIAYPAGVTLWRFLTQIVQRFPRRRIRSFRYPGCAAGASTLGFRVQPLPGSGAVWALALIAAMCVLFQRDARAA